MDFLSSSEFRYLFQILLSIFLGILIGIEREYIGKSAGMRTFALLTLGSTLFTIISREGFSGLELGWAVDPSRVAAGVVMGIGFLGAGIIIFRNAHVQGLTTAAAIWTTTGVGMAVGCGLYYLAIVATFAIFFVLTFLRKIRIEEVKKDEEPSEAEKEKTK